MKAARILLLLLLPAASAAADGFHSPLLREQSPRTWAQTVRESIGLDRADSAEEARVDGSRARDAAGPLVDLLRYLDRRNVLLREFPDFNYDNIPGFKSETEALLIAIGKDAVPLLVRALATDLGGEPSGTDLELAEDFVERVTRILVAIGEDAIGGVLAGLADDRPAVRKALLAILDEIVTDPDFGEDLSKWRAWHRIFLAGRSRDGAAVPDLLPYLTDPDKRLRIAAVKALGDIGLPAAAEGLRTALRASPDPLLQREAIRALVKIGDLSSAPLLVDLLESPRADVREEANTGLCFLARRSMGYDAKAPAEERAAAAARWREWCEKR